MACEPLDHYRPPRRALLWSEQLRATTEAAALVAALPLLTSGARGDGHRVLVLPGLLADDRSTAPLRHVLRARGYRAHAWGLGPNIGPTRRILTGVIDRLADLRARDDAPVTLIGWSLGGLMAREVARLAPDRVRAVITLGSPFRLGVERDAWATHASPMFNVFRPWHMPLFDGPQREEERVALAVPATSLYSKLDGIVPWQACLDLQGPLRESIEVRATHLGFGVNPEVLAIVLDRLAQPAGAWQKYSVRGVPA